MTAAVPDQADTSYLLLTLAQTTYGIRGDWVREVIRWREPTPVPGTPDLLPGIINQRGVILTVIDMRALLALPETPPNRATRYVITKNVEVEAALLCDSVLDLVSLSAAVFEPLPSSLDPQRARLFERMTRVNDTPIALFDLAAIMSTLQATT